MHKTKKSVAKRIKLSRKGKMMRRAMGVDHFRTRKNAKMIRNKRNRRGVSVTDARIFKKYLPFDRAIRSVSGGEQAK